MFDLDDVSVYYITDAAKSFGMRIARQVHGQCVADYNAILDLPNIFVEVHADARQIWIVAESAGQKQKYWMTNLNLLDYEMVVAELVGPMLVNFPPVN